jgi:hypothetical protein
VRDLKVLNTEAAAAALLLDAKMVLSRPTARGQLGTVLSAENIEFETVDLPAPEPLFGGEYRDGPTPDADRVRALIIPF